MVNEIEEVLSEVRELAVRYYSLTGKPLGVTSEVGEFEAVRLLGLTLAVARTPGYDAVDDRGKKYQIKTRRISRGDERKSHRCGGLKLVHEWDFALLVLLDDGYLPIGIWKADRASIQKVLAEPGSKARTERGALSVSKFWSIGKCVWGRRPG